jgi:predicted metal-binding protein
MADKLEEAKKLAADCGFSHFADMAVDTIQMRTEVRDACVENKCGQYGKSWACPPACGTLDECAAMVRNYRRGVILQTTGELEDEFDGEGTMEAAMQHGKRLEEFGDQIRALYPTALLIGAGGCRRCKECTYPDKPCRFPEKRTSSMEALGMVVSDVCKDNNLPYYYGKSTITYTSCVLLD